MAYTQAQFLVDFRDHLGDIGQNRWTDWQLLGVLRRAYEDMWPDFYLDFRDDSSYTRYASVPDNTNEIPVPAAFRNGDIFNIYGRVGVYQPGNAFVSTFSNPAVFLTTTAHGLALNQAVQLDGPSTALPAGFSSGTTYYVQTVVDPKTFILSATVGGMGIPGTTAGSGFVGPLFTDNTYRNFNKLERGLKIDPLTQANPYIRFTRIWGRPYELRIEGASQLSYPSTTFTCTAGNAVLTAAAGYTPVFHDQIYFQYDVPTGGFYVGGAGQGGITPYYVVSPSGQNFSLAPSLLSSAITPTSTGTYNILPGSQVLPGTDYPNITNFLRWDGELLATHQRQRSGNLDRGAMAQRRLLAGQALEEVMKTRMRPDRRTDFRYIG